VLKARGRSAVVCLAFGSLLIFGNVARSQSHSNAFPASKDRPLGIPRPCADQRPIPNARRESVAAREADGSEKLCAERSFDGSVISSPWHSDEREQESGDPVAEEMSAMGERGLTILRAREEVMRILESQNRCAAWFLQAEPDALRKFRSLHYGIDQSAPQYALKIQRPDGAWLLQQPYVASSVEGASAGSTITINGQGAFFQKRSGLRIVPRDGGPGGLSTAQLLQIDLYLGGTRSAQVVALLHEFSHIAGLLPADGGTLAGGELSTQNTQIVLRHCRAQVEAAGRGKGLLLNPGIGLSPPGKP
jgi:hypothetical protein